jgi:multiple sugar transport system substrate-binding protein
MRLSRRILLGSGAAAASTPLIGARAQARPITFWHVFNLETDMVHGAIRLWNQRNPSTPIEARIVPLAQLNAELTRAVTTGAVPDVSCVDGSAAASFSSQGLLEDITDQVQASTVIRWADIYPGPKSAGTWRGRIYSVPRAVNTLAIYYNKDMFAAKGLDPEKPPQTWSAFNAAVEKLTDKDKNVFGITFSAIQSEEGTFQWLPWLQQAGGSVAKLDAPEAASALQLWVDWVAKGQASKDVVTMRQYEATNTFIAGNAAMVEGGPWELPRVQAEAKFKWGVALLPVKDDKNIRASALGDFMLGIPKGSKNAAAGFKVIEHMLSDEVVATAWGTGRMPPRPGVAIPADLPYRDAYGVFAEQMKYARVRGPHPRWPELSRPIQTAIQEAITGRASASEALGRAARALQPILAQVPLAE